LVSPAKLTDFIEGREIFKKGGGNAAKRTRRKRKLWPSCIDAGEVMRIRAKQVIITLHLTVIDVKQHKRMNKIKEKINATSK